MYCFKLGNLKSIRCDKIRWLYQQGIVNKDVWLAGGSLRTLIDPKDEVVDYDLFFRNQGNNPPFDGGFDNTNIHKVQETKQKLINLGFNCTFECPEGKLYTYTLPKNWCIHCGCEQDEHHRVKWARNKIFKVQLICENFYESPEHLLSTFDLSPTYFCTDGEFLWTSKLAIKSVKNKFCELLHLTYPVSTIKRIIKYSNKGYNINSAVQGVVSNLINRHSISSEEMRVYID